MKMFVGLGNPGQEFDRTYHNIGFMAIDKLAENLGVNISKQKFNALYSKTCYNDCDILLVKPLTYMNLSGEAVKQFADYYKISPEDIIVFCDDIDLPKGTTRYREKGSGGTHNGLKNIVYKLNSENFRRIKIGAGNDKSLDLKDYVLSKIDEESLSKINDAIDEGIEKAFEIVLK